ncbi:MAG TPA: metallophosphoesterase family protein, partial [Elusimicrobiales bacterium]|nr:metallophosphoesterase family protein [Elusimicrobiales bacterium]
LRAVLEFYRRNDVADYICCGDVVGYGPQPLECVETISALERLHIVMGNHDGALTGRIDIKWFNNNAAAAIVYARSRLTGKALNFLANLPEKVETAEFTLVHGSPRKPLTEYMLSESQFADNAASWKVSPCFIGHSHMPMFFRGVEGAAPETDFLKPMMRISTADGRMMFNPGSVGQPRDGDPRAACGIYDSGKKTFELYRVFYDVETTQKMMGEAKLPAMLAERLSFGY